MKVVTDADILSLLTPADAVAWTREAVLAAHAGRLHTPPRVSAELGDGRLVFTTGALTGEWYGYRSYDSFDTDPGSQLVVVHDWHTGAVCGVAVGNELGPRRVGAIGAVAVDVLAEPGCNHPRPDRHRHPGLDATVGDRDGPSAGRRSRSTAGIRYAGMPSPQGFPRSSGSTLVAVDSARDAVVDRDLVVPGDQ